MPIITKTNETYAGIRVYCGFNNLLHTLSSIAKSRKEKRMGRSCSCYECACL